MNLFERFIGRPVENITDAVPYLTDELLEKGGAVFRKASLPGEIFDPVGNLLGETPVYRPIESLTEIHNLVERANILRQNFIDSITNKFIFMIAVAFILVGALGVAGLAVIGVSAAVNWADSFFRQAQSSNQPTVAIPTRGMPGVTRTVPTSPTATNSLADKTPRPWPTAQLPGEKYCYFGGDPSEFRMILTTFRFGVSRDLSSDEETIIRKAKKGESVCLVK